MFFDEQGNPIVIDEQVAGFSPDQLQAMQMQRQALGIQNPFLMGAGEAFGAGTQALEEGLQRGRICCNRCLRGYERWCRIITNWFR